MIEMQFVSRIFLYLASFQMGLWLVARVWEKTKAKRGSYGVIIEYDSKNAGIRKVNTE